MLLGFTIGFLVIYGSQHTIGDCFSPRYGPLGHWFTLMDMVGIMVRRIRSKGQSPLRPDRNHLHHILMHAGFSPRESLFMMAM